MLFAEKSRGTTLESARVFAADKVLKMLEWISEDEEDERAEKRASR
jgi:hypothetical protein